MKRSCRYCGRVHDSKYICESKKHMQEIRQSGHNAQDTFRWSRRWKKKAREIKQRDGYMCQCCLRLYAGTVRQYEYDRLEVHHIVPIAEDESKKMSNKNLITLCRYHHEAAEKKEINRRSLLSIAKEQEMMLEKINNELFDTI